MSSTRQFSNMANGIRDQRTIGDRAGLARMLALESGSWPLGSESWKNDINALHGISYTKFREIKDQNQTKFGIRINFLLKRRYHK